MPGHGSTLLLSVARLDTKRLFDCTGTSHSISYVMQVIIDLNHGLHQTDQRDRVSYNRHWQLSSITHQPSTIIRTFRYRAQDICPLAFSDLVAFLSTKTHSKAGSGPPVVSRESLEGLQKLKPTPSVVVEELKDLRREGPLPIKLDGAGNSEDGSVVAYHKVRSSVDAAATADANGDGGAGAGASSGGGR